MRSYRLARRSFLLGVGGVRLVIEVDGGAHLGRTKPDARRDRLLGKRGYRVLRLAASLVLGRPRVAVARIRAAIAGG